MRSGALVLASLLSLTGCAATVLRSGHPPGDSPPGFDDHWHSAFLFGALEVGEPYDLDQLCPGGWSEVTVQPDPLTTVVGALTLFLYTPNRVTVVCSAPGSLGVPPREGAALPPAPEHP